MGPISKTITALCAVGTLWFGYKSVSNIVKGHQWDKYVTKYVEATNGIMTAGRKEGVISMEDYLDQAADQAKRWKGENTAFIWETPFSDTDTFISITADAQQRAHEIGQFEEALRTNRVPENAVAWVKDTYEILRTEERNSRLAKRLAYSEEGQTIASAYEALNDVIAGGTRVSGDATVYDRSLVEILDEAAGFKAFIRGEAGDYKKAAAYTKLAVIYANMGYIDMAIRNLEGAYHAIEHFPDDKNLSIWRGTVTMSQKYLEDSLKSAIDKLKEIDSTNPELKYSTGWWDRVAKMTESLGGQKTPCITDLAKNVSGGFDNRLYLFIPLTLAFGTLSIAVPVLTRD